MNELLKESYNKRVKKFDLLLKKTINHSKILSFIRLFDFIVAIVLIYVFTRLNIVPGIILTVFISIGLFIYLVKYHSRVLTTKKMDEAKIAINEQEIQALEGNIQKLDKGEDFLDHQHPYVTDVDIFGEGSLFQFLNRNASLIGRRKLATLLKFPFLEREKILENQSAIKEVANFIDWRQHFQAIGKVYEEKADDSQRVLDWALAKPLFKNGIFTFLLITIPVLTAIMVYLLTINEINFNVFIVYLVIPWGISGSFAIKVNRRHIMVSKTSKMLVKYALLLREIENGNFTSAKLVSLQKVIKEGSGKASKSIKDLSAILTALDNRLNFVSWALFNGLLLWDILQMKRLENWQEKHKEDMHNWFEVIAEVDALNSLANYQFNNLDSVFPELNSSKTVLEAKNLGHPLIDAKVRVSNDFLIAENEFFIITGANMAGKSTFLRTIVVNMILAMCGAPVCADKFKFKPIQIFTSIRTNDSLYKNESYFYSELKRLKQIIDELKTGEKLFVVLDEILKGTNSKDKHSGSEALLKQFITLKTCGIVATHDIGLGKLESIFPESIKNKCFEVDINGSILTFDYKIRDGISKNMNATILMREMGITV